jgi:HlyD family secretion protein
VVVSREVDLGQTVAASFQTPTLFKIARDLKRMQIDSNVAEADIGKIAVGQPVRFTVDAFPERRFEGKVGQIRLNPIVNQNVVTYNVVVKVDNPDLVLLPGMTAYLSIVTDRRSDALLVPNAALRFRPPEARPSGNSAAADPGGSRAGGRRGAAAGEPGARPGGATVYVVRGEELAPVSVRTGISDGRLTVVEEGALQPGDRLAVEDLLAAPSAAPQGQGQQPFRIRAF